MSNSDSNWWPKSLRLKLLFKCWAGFGGWADGWMNVKSGVRDYLVQSKNECKRGETVLFFIMCKHVRAYICCVFYTTIGHSWLDNRVVLDHPVAW